MPRSLTAPAPGVLSAWGAPCPPRPCAPANPGLSRPQAPFPTHTARRTARTRNPSRRILSESSRGFDCVGSGRGPMRTTVYVRTRASPVRGRSARLAHARALTATTVMADHESMSEVVGQPSTLESQTDFLDQPSLRTQQFPSPSLKPTASPRYAPGKPPLGLQTTPVNTWYP